MARADSDQHGWDTHFLEVAQLTAQRATCHRLPHGAVVVDRDHQVIATGATASPAGVATCAQAPVDTDDTTTGSQTGSHLCTATHAVATVLLATDPGRRRNATVYVTTAPCRQCAKLLATSGIGEVVASGGRHEAWDDTRRHLLDAGVRVRVLDGLEGLPRLAVD